MTKASFMTGQLLIAMPALADPNFARTVTFICEHSEQGALGIVINRPLELDLGDVFKQLNFADSNAATSTQPVLLGGPVQMERGFVIHESEAAWENSTDVADSIRVTTSQDILESMASGDGPKRAAVALGYAGWGAGQLEREIAENAWLNTPADPQILFETPYEERWQKSADLIGVDLTLLGPAGHA